MESGSIDVCIERMIELGLAKRSELQGCTYSEIQHIEDSFSLTLPLAYKEFLSKAGKSAGTFMEGSDFLYPLVLKQKEFAESMLEQMGADFSLSAEDYVFMGHQGYSFLFFGSGHVDDPPVLLVSEEGTIGKEVAKSFTDWLAGCIEDEAAAEAALHDSLN